MLGLADRAQTIALFESLLGGRTAEALEQFRAPSTASAPIRRRSSPTCSNTPTEPPSPRPWAPTPRACPTIRRNASPPCSAAVSAGSLARVWQMLLKAYAEGRKAPDPTAATEMAIVRIAYASDLPGLEEGAEASAIG